MGIRVCDGGDVAFIYESTGGRPFGLAAFESAEEAESFIQYIERAGGRYLWRSEEELERLRDVWQALPRCLICDERVIAPCDAPDECEKCQECDEGAEGDSLTAAVNAEVRRQRMNVKDLEHAIVAATGRRFVIGLGHTAAMPEEIRAVLRYLRTHKRAA